MSGDTNRHGGVGTTVGENLSGSKLLPLVCDELRRLAASRLARENPGQTLQLTALVHEAWMRLASESGVEWKSKAQFSAAAEAMRRILIERTRAKRSLKRGSDPVRELLRESQIEVLAPDDEVLAVDEALEALAKEDPQAAEWVKLRNSVGCTIPEIADIVVISPRTADRQWAFARAWLKREIKRGS